MLSCVEFGKESGDGLIRTGSITIPLEGRNQPLTEEALHFLHKLLLTNHREWVSHVQCTLQ